MSDLLEMGDRRIVELNGCEIVVLRVDDDLVAYENRCPHMGGPVGLGLVLPRVEVTLEPDGTPVERLSDTETRLVCPWHGWEFDARTGRCAADRRYGLIRREVVVRGEDVYVEA